MRSGPLLLLVLTALTAGCFLPPGPGAARPYYEEVLSGDPFTTLVIQVDHAPGRAPGEAAKTHLMMTLRNVTSKTDIRWDVAQTLPGDGDKAWTSEELVAVEKSLRRTEHEAPVALLHVLYPAGTYAGARAAGVTISGPVLGPVTVFLDVIREISLDAGVPAGPLRLPNPQAGVETVERATLLHEAGHAMGLVDNGLPMVTPREDAEHEGHTRNPASVMYWAVEVEDGLREYLLRDGSIPDRFDADDLADLRSAGGRR